ncbi:MAG: response regulator [Candidatus Omnitrophica bacterium]|nr:response regulator [Candidatus Omnitrophota bacterium]
MYLTPARPSKDWAAWIVCGGGDVVCFVRDTIDRVVSRVASEYRMASNGHRVLVIDDDEKLLGVYEGLLARHGFAVTTCPDTTQVLPLLKASAFEVALLDIKMPGIEGTDLLPLIKKLCPDLPVILVSAYCDDANAGYYHSLGAFGIIPKPFSHEILLDTVSRALDEQEHIPMVLTSLSLRDGRDQLYRKLLLTALRKTEWNQVKAAELLGVSRYCLIRWLKKLGISY